MLSGDEYGAFLKIALNPIMFEPDSDQRMLDAILNMPRSTRNIAGKSYLNGWIST